MGRIVIGGGRMAVMMIDWRHDIPGDQKREYSGYTQDSPHISNRSKYVCEERLLVQHLRETLHQRAQPLFAHGWD